MSTIPTIKEDTLINITVNGSFYGRVQHMMMYLVETLEPQRIQELFNKINNDQIDEPLAAHLQTLAVLMNEIEREAEAAGLVEQTEVEDSESES